MFSQKRTSWPWNLEFHVYLNKFEIWVQIQLNCFFVLFGFEGLCLGWTACSILSPFCVCSPNSITCFHDDKSSYNSKHPFNQQNSTSYYLQTYIAKFLVSDKQIKLAANKQIRYQNKMYFQQTAVSKTLFINSIYGLRFNYTYDNA